VNEERTGRELAPRPEEPPGAVTPREAGLPRPSASAVERFSAGEQAHTVGLTEERSAQIVRQSSNARMMAFLVALIVVLFIPVYWLYDIGMPVVGDQGRLAAEQQGQYITDVSRGYALFLANCARCHGDNGQGLIGPPLNDQGKLYNAVTAQGLAGPGHLNPDYLLSVLTEGGRYVCGDPTSVMPAWLQPKGPLNYREVDQIIAFITASSDTTFTYQPAQAEGATGTPPPAVTEHGWRDPNYTPPPDATPVPACWRAPAQSSAAPATPGTVTNPGTPDNPRVIELQASDQLTWVDPTSGQQISSITVVQGETVEFHIMNPGAIDHNFHIASADQLSSAPQDTDLPGVQPFHGSTQTFTYTFDNIPDNPQFACTMPGHYPTMHGDFVVIPASSSGSPAPSAEASPVPSAEASAAPSAVASAGPSAAPSVAPSAAPSASPSVVQSASPSP
jgi:mono/diheme cytochrome c family protein/uncharacterized cupredoxin-like copper-binding protein